MSDDSVPVKKQLFPSLNPWLIFLGLVSLLLTGAGVYRLLHQQNTASASSTKNEQPRIQKPQMVTALGRLEPQGEVIKISASSNTSDRISQLLVKEGSQVKSGQVIAILDSRDRLQASLEQAKAEVRIAQARLTQVKAGAKQGEIRAQDARFKQTQAELEGQIRTQKATIASLSAQLEGEKTAQQATIERLKAELRNAQKDCQRYETLHQDGAVSAQEKERFCLQAETAEDSLTEANANLNRLITTWLEKIKEAEANRERTVTTLNKQLIESQATLAAVAEVRPVDIQVAQADLMAAQSAVKKAQADLDLAYIKAPQAGEILKIQTWAGELVSSDGIVEIGQTNQMYAVAEVYETDITKVRLKQTATITSDALDGTLQGTVEQIGRRIQRQNIFDTNPTTDADSRIVEVKIRLDAVSSQKVKGLTNQRIRVAITI